MKAARMSGLFFTGTDTGVGKTFVTAAVARALRAAGQAVRVSKPVATGATCSGGRWLSEDTRCLMRAAGLPEGEGHEEAITPWSFRAAAAPPVAARLAGAHLRLEDLAEAVRRQACPGSVLLVEGVGGLLCPLAEEESVADLALALGLPVVVVARRSLGTLNHTLLTVEAALLRRLPVAGVVVSETEPTEGVAAETNVEELRRRLSVPLLGIVPFTPDEGQAARAVADIDWERLCGSLNSTRNRHADGELPLR